MATERYKTLRQRNNFALLFLANEFPLLLPVITDMQKIDELVPVITTFVSEVKKWKDMKRHQARAQQDA